MPSPYKRVFFGDYTFSFDENVYEPAEDSFLFAENLDVENGDTVLDMGTGCGILGILASKRAHWVLAVDLNPHAIRYAKENANLNQTRSRMAFLEGDLFTSLTQSAKFTVILFNAPYLPTAECMKLSWIERAWSGGDSGRQIIDRFIMNVRTHLRQPGRVMLMQSTLAGMDETIQGFEDCGMTTRIVVELSLPFFEKLLLIEAKIG